uniref:CSON009910 protein n=1 Tax=Culicoides sonorensis TaxID=179676 RepID=A0A336M4Y5_CULSO
MAEKDSGKYHYDPYTQISKSSSATAQLNMNLPGPSMKRMSTDSQEQPQSQSPCCACGSSAGSQNGPFWVGLLTNLGICALLFAYTLLAISRNLLQETHETRQRTVENIWDITVSLNILYRENWTRLAAIELAKFQDQIIKQIMNDMPPNAISTLQPPATGAITVPQSIQDYEWTFARAFLYSLTVLTTIGK